MFGMSIKEVDAFGLQQMQAQGEVIVIDVRTDVEFAQGSIQGAKHMPLHMLPLVADQMETDGGDLPQRSTFRPSVRLPVFEGLHQCV